MIAKLIEKIKQTNAPICVGLDPLISHIPDYILDEKIKKYGKSTKAVAEAFYDFNMAIIDKTFDLIPAVKPQIAMYEEFGIDGMIAYKNTVDYAKSKGLLVIGDAKRGDIGSTSLAYAKAHIGVSEISGEKLSGFDTDFVTVNPYLGTDGIKPFIDVCNSEDKGIFVLVKTSNPSSGEFQDRQIDGTPLYELVAKKTCEWGELSMDGEYSNVGAVVGATYPKMSAILREKMPHTFFLVPGYGAQGATAEDLKPCFNKDGLGAIVNSSRGIIAAYKQEKYASLDFANASRAAVKDMIADINRVL
ncbi:orotidine-5'-phosphate decarboxylase [Lachnoanaerobaculum saburreum]|uniref:Orotidine 5'-phosphate decarboxylase n=1 Tax=Lachnoanaerobaculum saburreum DSM 3986 TaxID=887325 RepID=E6LR40_9FIRM|nr:orotidine-5'-phosphate decarboxylase [Lachnoanaerobaculum saburreum]EFU75736.1 orotidine 5'-phosphate decarboxylase [Lachnoanaerobaculum saburreum DSM 3986]